jgi:hypothetical protein
MSSEKNAEIWSTRLQKELLALTTTDETKEVAGILPPFLKVQNHDMDINEGICKVYFIITVPSPEGTVEEDVVICMDASLARNADGTLDANAAAYPFAKPTATLESGATRFPEGSAIASGDAIYIDCDWTPSLHLTDAVLNVGLKIKESVLQGEPFFAAEAEEDHVKAGVDELVNSARRFTSFLGKSAKQLVDNTNEKTKTKLAAARRKKAASAKTKKTNAEEIVIGDEIHFLEAPWVDCRGLYSCKAIRRPAFVEDAIFLGQTKLASKKAAEQQQSQVSSSFGVDDDGQLPDDFGQFVKVQADTISKVCRSFIFFYISLILP